MSDLLTRIGDLAVQCATLQNRLAALETPAHRPPYERVRGLARTRAELARTERLLKEAVAAYVAGEDDT